MMEQNNSKYYRDEHVLTPHANPIGEDHVTFKPTLHDKKIAVEGYGVSPENFDKIIGVPKEEIDRERNLQESKIKLGICYEEIKQQAKKYIDLSDEKIEVLSLWILGTYFHKEFEAYPFLFLNAMRGSGKTRTEKFISFLSKGGDGSVMNNLTEAVLFRHPKHTIMCIDEIEGIGSKDKQTLRELLNSSYKKGMQVKRMKKIKKEGVEKLEVEVFEPYFPIVLANIWGLEEVLSDRSITIILEKSNNPYITKKIEDFDRNPAFNKIKRTLESLGDVSDVTLRSRRYIYGWNPYIEAKYSNSISSSSSITSLTSLTSQQEIDEIERDEFFNKIDESGIEGRNFELFFPLLILARGLNIEVFEKVLSIIKLLVQGKKEDEYVESKDVSLYQFVAENIKEEELNALKEITLHFRLFVGDTGNEELWVNEKWMGRALKRLDLVIYKKKMRQGSFVILNVAKAKEKIKMFKSEKE